MMSHGPSIASISCPGSASLAIERYPPATRLRAYETAEFRSHTFVSRERQWETRNRRAGDTFLDAGEIHSRQEAVVGSLEICSIVGNSTVLVRYHNQARSPLFLLFGTEKPFGPPQMSLRPPSAPWGDAYPGDVLAWRGDVRDLGLVAQDPCSPDRAKLQSASAARVESGEGSTVTAPRHTRDLDESLELRALAKARVANACHLEVEHKVTVRRRPGLEEKTTAAGVEDAPARIAVEAPRSRRGPVMEREIVAVELALHHQGHVRDSPAKRARCTSYSGAGREP